MDLSAFGAWRAIENRRLQRPFSSDRRRLVVEKRFLDEAWMATNCGGGALLGLEVPRGLPWRPDAPLFGGALDTV